MSRTVSPGAGKAYGMARVCRAWRMARATVCRHRQAPHGKPPRRPGPIGPRTDAAALVAAIRTVLAGSPFHGEGHRKVWARLRMERGEDLQAPGVAPDARARPARPVAGRLA